MKKWGTTFIAVVDRLDTLGSVLQIVARAARQIKALPWD